MSNQKELENYMEQLELVRAMAEFEEHDAFEAEGTEESYEITIGEDKNDDEQ